MSSDFSNDVMENEVIDPTNPDFAPSELEKVLYWFILFGTDEQKNRAHKFLTKRKLKKNNVKCKRCKIPGGNLREVVDQNEEYFIICRECWVDAVDNEEHLHNCSDDWTDDEDEDEEQ